MEGMLPGAFGDLIQGRHDDSLTGEVPKPLASALPLAPAPHSPRQLSEAAPFDRFIQTFKPRIS